jgi:hypothetical protein
MRSTESFVKDYLTEKTEYAIQLTGNWGIGKTHYYKSAIRKIVKETPTIQNETKMYKPVYISLFGLKTIEDISTKIVLEFYQSKYFSGYFRRFRIRKVLRISHGIFKVGLRGFMQVKKFGNLNYHLADLKSIANNTLTEHELFICFDDLERTDSSLSMEDLIGYINSLVDEGVKVLIINNDNAIDSKEYKNLKEKVVGVTIPFSLPTEEVVQSIIKDRFSGYKTYTSFLESNLISIVKISDAINNNYRHLIYALTKFQKCYSEIQNNIISINHELKQQVEDNLWLIAKTSIVIAIEYKASNLKREDEIQFSQNIITFIRSLPEPYAITNTEDKPKPAEGDPKMNFKYISEKYSIDLSDFKFFKSIFNHLINFQVFDIEKFEEEFRSKFRMVDGEIRPQYKILNNLSHGECVKLGDEEYLSMTNEMIDYAEKGEYFPHEYLTVMFYTERFNNAFGVDLVKTLKRLKDGLRISIFSREENTQKTQFSMSLSINMSDENKELHSYGMELFDKAKQERSEDQLRETQKNILKSAAVFISEYNELESFRIYVRTNPVFAGMPIADFVDALTNTDGETILLLKYFFEERYEDKSMLKKEIDTVSNAITPLNDWYDENLDLEKLKSQLIKELTESLNALINV